MTVSGSEKPITGLSKETGGWLTSQLAKRVDNEVHASNKQHDQHLSRQVAGYVCTSNKSS